MTLVRYAMPAVLLFFGAGIYAYGDDTVSKAPSPAPENNGATTIDAMRLEVYLGREMRAFGDAEIRRDGQLISGDKIFLNTINDEIHAIGNVHVKQGDTIADGPELRLKMYEREGEMTEPVFHILDEDGENKARGNASTILFEGPLKERLKSARYTTCEEGVDDWYLRAGELEIDHHTETATATNASIEFKGVPFLYTPWIDFPFANQRKTGFLTPTFGSTTRSGLELSVPYYWNIAPNMDATLTSRYMSKRGIQLQGQFRYLDEHGQGIDLLDYLPNDDETGKTRFAINLKHHQDFGDGWSGNLQFERVSDDQYFSDMSTHITLTSRVNLPQQADLHYDKNDWHFAALVQKYQTLDDLSFPYQRVPQLTMNGYEELGPLDANLAGEYVRFDINSAAPSTVTGSRHTLYPSLSLPLLASYGFITPKVGVHYTGYNLDNPGTAFDEKSRTLPIFSLDSGLYFDRNFRVVKNMYTQTLEPRLYYVYIPYQNQNRLPNFDTGISDLNLTTLFTENQFTGGDRLNDANQVTLALTSRLIDQSTGIQRLSATIGERFYFTDQKVTACGPNSKSTDAVCTAPVRTGLHSDFLTVISAKLLNHWNADFAWQYNTVDSQTIKSNVTARYQPEPGKVLNLGYRFTRDSLEQLDASSQWPLAPNWYGLGRINYSLRSNAATNDKRGPAEVLAGVEYDAGCWQVRAVVHRLSTATANANYAMFFQLILGGISSIGSNPMDVIKRNIPGYTNTDLISDSDSDSTIP